MYVVTIEDHRDGFQETVAEFDSEWEALVYVEDTLQPYYGRLDLLSQKYVGLSTFQNKNYTVFVEKKYHYDQSDYYYDSDRYRNCGYYDDDDPIEDYYGELEEQRYWDQVFATPKSIVAAYFPKWSPSSALVDPKNFWYLGILRNLEDDMPYIKPEDRDNFSFPLLKAIEQTEIGSPGNLNFLITTLCKKFLSEDKESYERHNAIVGVLDAAKLEWYRRRVAPYEDKKIAENGDV